MPGIDMQKTDERIQTCLAHRPAVTSPPSSQMSVAPLDGAAAPSPGAAERLAPPRF